jgi:hypothetical protein
VDIEELEALSSQIKELAAAIEKLIQQGLADLNRGLIQAGASAIRIGSPEMREMRRLE